jgi:hypothetical protein
MSNHQVPWFFSQPFLPPHPNPQAAKERLSTGALVRELERQVLRMSFGALKHRKMEMSNGDFHLQKILVGDIIAI